MSGASRLLAQHALPFFFFNAKLSQRAGSSFIFTARTLRCFQQLHVIYTNRLKLDSQFFLQHFHQINIGDHRLIFGYTCRFRNETNSCCFFVCKRKKGYLKLHFKHLLYTVFHATVLRCSLIFFSTNFSPFFSTHASHFARPAKSRNPGRSVDQKQQSVTGLAMHFKVVSHRTTALTYRHASSKQTPLI